MVETYFEVEKLKDRDTQMVRNIKENLIDGKNVVLTGAAHLTFFKEHIPEATLLFRD